MVSYLHLCQRVWGQINLRTSVSFQTGIFSGVHREVCQKARFGLKEMNIGCLVGN